jgi:hypothetical protein
MPIDATPFEQVVVVAVATNATGEETVEPLFGLVTVTLAKTGAANDKTKQTRKRVILMTVPSTCVWACEMKI